MTSDQNNRPKSQCKCGRSPNGFCIGWHNLTESEYKTKLSDWQFQEYQRQSSELWNDSCTTSRIDQKK